jgi:hypothetical protein
MLQLEQTLPKIRVEALDILFETFQDLRRLRPALGGKTVGSATFE